MPIKLYEPEAVEVEKNRPQADFSVPMVWTPPPVRRPFADSEADFHIKPPTMMERGSNTPWGPYPQPDPRAPDIRDAEGTMQVDPKGFEVDDVSRPFTGLKKGR
jgi:hypothetical protein